MIKYIVAAAIALCTFAWVPAHALCQTDVFITVSGGVQPECPTGYIDDDTSPFGEEGQNWTWDLNEVAQNWSGGGASQDALRAVYRSQLIRLQDIMKQDFRFLPPDTVTVPLTNGVIYDYWVPNGQYTFKVQVPTGTGVVRYRIRDSRTNQFIHDSTTVREKQITTAYTGTYNSPYTSNDGLNQWVTEACTNTSCTSRISGTIRVYADSNRWVQYKLLNFQFGIQEASAGKCTTPNMFRVEGQSGDKLCVAALHSRPTGNVLYWNGLFGTNHEDTASGQVWGAKADPWKAGPFYGAAGPDWEWYTTPAGQWVLGKYVTPRVVERCENYKDECREVLRAGLIAGIKGKFCDADGGAGAGDAVRHGTWAALMAHYFHRNLGMTVSQAKAAADSWMNDNEVRDGQIEAGETTGCQIVHPNGTYEQKSENMDCNNNQIGLDAWEDAITADPGITAVEVQYTVGDIMETDPGVILLKNPTQRYCPSRQLAPYRH